MRVRLVGRHDLRPKLVAVDGLGVTVVDVGEVDHQKTPAAGGVVKKAAVHRVDCADKAG